MNTTSKMIVALVALAHLDVAPAVAGQSVPVVRFVAASRGVVAVELTPVPVFVR